MKEEVRNIKENYKISGKMLGIIIFIEFLIPIIAIILDVICGIPLYTLGRFIHYYVGILYFSNFLWVHLPEKELNINAQILLFIIIPHAEFLIIQFLHLSNLWGLLFLGLYYGILSAILDINFNQSSSDSSNDITNKIVKNTVRGLFKK